MRKMKKFLAILLASTMTLGMGMTTMAAPSETAPYKSTITVNGLADGVDTTVTVYKMITLDEAENNWVVEPWAEDYVTLTDAAYELNITADNMDEFKNKALAAANADSENALTAEVNGTSRDFEVEVGAYAVLATDAKATYNAMVANTYDNSKTYMASKDATVVAKTSGYEVKKEADDEFVAKGQEVTFTVTTTYPTFPENSTNRSYKLIDTATGLEITSVDSIMVGTENLVESATCEYKENSTTEYVIDLSATVGTGDNFNQHAGKTVVVTYKATVTTDKGYVNTVNAFRDDVALDPETPPTVDGFTGDITITKYASDENNDKLTDNTVLNGAKFKVYHATKDEVKADGSTVEALYFTEKKDADGKTAVGEYELAKAGDAGAAQEIVAINGTVKVSGLEAGNYWFEETKAPLGYSINEDGVAAEIQVKDKTAAPAEKELEVGAHVSVTGTLVDTKLIALPSTGGIGTTIFTVAGCGIMIAAAAFFFAGRKKEEN